MPYETESADRIYLRHVPSETPAEAPAPAIPPRCTPVKSSPAPVAAESGILNGRYEVLDPLADWKLGSLVSCRDRQAGETVLCVLAEESATLLSGIQRVANLRLPELITPMRMIRAQGYRPRQTGFPLADGSVILIFPDDGTHAILETRPKTGPGATSLANALRILRPLAEILDSGHAAQEPGIGSEFEMGGAGLIVDPAHRGAGDPATIIAALAALMLADPADLHLQVAHNGVQRVIPAIPFAANQVLIRQLTSAQARSSLSADAFLDELQVNFRVQLDSYLDQGQIRHLRDRLGLDDEQIRALIRKAAGRTRPGINLINDQNPARILQRDLDAALTASHARKERETHEQHAHTVRRGLTIGASVLSLVALLIWWLSNDGPQPMLQKPGDSAGPGMARATFTRDQGFSDSFPSRCYRHLPENADKAVFYAQVADAATGDAITLVIKDQHGSIIGQYSITIPSKNCWVYLPFPISGRSDFTSATGQVLLNGRLLREITCPVADSWFDGISRLCVTLGGIWMAFGVVLWWSRRASVRE